MRQLLGASHNDTSIISMACINFLVAFLLQNKWVVDIGDWRQEMRATLQFLSVAIAAIAFQFILMPTSSAEDCNEQNRIMGLCGGGGGGQVQGQTPWVPGQPLPGPDGTIPGGTQHRPPGGQQDWQPGQPLPGPQGMLDAIDRDLRDTLIGQGFVDRNLVGDPRQVGPDLAALGALAGNCNGSTGTIENLIEHHERESRSSVSHATVEVCRTIQQVEAQRGDPSQAFTAKFTDPRTREVKLCITSYPIPNQLGLTSCPAGGIVANTRYPNDEASIDQVNEFLLIAQNRGGAFNLGVYAADMASRGEVVDLTDVSKIVRENPEYLTCGFPSSEAPSGANVQRLYDSQNIDRKKSLKLQAFMRSAQQRQGSDCGSAAAQGGGTGGIIQN